MKNKFSIATVLLLIILAYSCSVVNFAKCKFDFHSISDVAVCGINVGQKTALKDFSVTDGLKLANGLATKQFPVSLNVNVNVQNPNTATARLDGFDYILWIDDQKMVAGNMTKQMVVGAGATQVMPVNFSVNLYEFFADKGQDKLISLACGLATSDKARSRVKLSIKPYFTIGNTIMRYPSYITIGGDSLMPNN